MRASVSLEAALVFLIFIPVLVTGLAIFVWVNNLREMSIIEQTWGRTLQPSINEAIRANWDSLTIGNVAWNQFIDNSIQRFNDYLARTNLRQDLNILIQISVWQINFNPESGAFLGLTMLTERQLTLNDFRVFNQDLQNFNAELANALQRIPPLRITLGSIPVHYHFGPTIFGNVTRINFLPNRFFISYFYGVFLNSNIMEWALNTLNQINLAPNTRYIRGRLLPVI